MWQELRDELDRWSAAGKRLRLWIRDDDAIEPSAQLDRLIELSRRFETPILLAVIPMLAQPAMALRLAAAPLLRPCQHGYLHRNHAPCGGKAEFGPHRAPEIMREEIAQGWRRLRDLFGARAVAVFAPPWNRIDARLAARLPALGFVGASAIRTTPVAPAPGLAVHDSDLDIIDWKGGRVGKAHARLIDELLSLLQAKRAEPAAAPALGVLTHHLTHDRAAWEFMDDLLAMTAEHPAVQMTDPLDLFGSAQAVQA